MRDLRAHHVEMLTLGQYLQPSVHHLPVERYAPPEEFEHLRGVGEALGFTHVASAPLVRSSYHADLQAQGAGSDSEGGGLGVMMVRPMSGRRSGPIAVPSDAGALLGLERCLRPGAEARKPFPIPASIAGEASSGRAISPASASAAGRNRAYRFRSFAA
jgi:hypothetical protein